MKSGLFIPGDGKALIRLRGVDNSYLLAASQNQGDLKIFKKREMSQTRPLISLRPDDRVLLLTLTNGKIRREEPYYGSSFLSQSSRTVEIGKGVIKMEIINTKGEKRSVF